MRVLVVNAGSSSLKLRLLDAADEVMARCDLPAVGGRFDSDAIAEWVEGSGGAGAVDAVGHRIVHGGTRFRRPVRLDAAVERQLADLVELAPLHQPKSLAAVAAVARVLPDTPAVACFDTAFHATLPPAAATYAVPAQWRERFGVRRFGFHGLSHEYAARRATQLLGRAAARLVTCHLGAGASLAAVRDGVCVDTTMGFTPLEGLVMATRCGSLDPGLVLWLEERVGLSPREVAEALEHDSGLLALTGTADMREILTRRAQGDPAAVLGLDVYVHRLRSGIAAMTAALGGLDALAFTGGVGEREPEVRAAAAAGLGYLGVHLDEAANAGADADAELGRGEGPVRIVVVTAREDLVIADAVRIVLGAE